LRQSITAWLDELAEGLPPGSFRFIAKDSLIPVDGRGGQMATCFAMKIAWQTSLWPTWDEERKQGCIAFI
jgi:hypothetical protein